MKRLVLATSFSIAALTAAPVLGLAEEPAASEHRVSGLVEGGAAYAALTEGYPIWNDQFLKASLQLTPDDRLSAEVSRQSHFGDAGVFFGAGYTRHFDDRWYGSLNIGTSTRGFFLPRIRLDAFLYRKWLERKSLVTNIGFAYYRSRDVYFDRALLAGATYYFDGPWIVEVGGRLNDSSPGGVRSLRGFAALTYGYDQRHFFVLRYEGGREAYQVVGTSAAGALVGFSSQEASLTWRQWVLADFGLNLRASHYRGPYRRTGLELGIFYEF
jgi:YaiO family outer membrane protein